MTVIQIEYNFKGVQKSFSTTVLNKKVIYYSDSNVCTLKQYTIIFLRIPPDCESQQLPFCFGPQVQKLQGILKPMMLRRLKEDVEKKLAPKEETIIEVELTNIQKKYYRAILEKNFSFLAKGAGQANMPNLVNTMMELRKCCNHPYLIKGTAEVF